MLLPSKPITETGKFSFIKPQVATGKKKKKDKSKTSKYSRGIYFIVPKHMRHENQEEEQIHAVSEARTQKRENE
jgi:hypothetical protein